MGKLKQNLVVLLVVSMVFAGEVNANPAGSGKDAPSIIVDVFICRPLGILALAGGFGGAPIPPPLKNTTPFIPGGAAMPRRGK